MVTRREFLKFGPTFLAAITLAACSDKKQNSNWQEVYDFGVVEIPAGETHVFGHFYLRNATRGYDLRFLTDAFQKVANKYEIPLDAYSGDNGSLGVVLFDRFPSGDDDSGMEVYLDAKDGGEIYISSNHISRIVNDALSLNPDRSHDEAYSSVLSSKVVGGMARLFEALGFMGTGAGKYVEGHYFASLIGGDLPLVLEAQSNSAPNIPLFIP